jgi:2-keto-3-deoxy-L-rhamnonate aldolase RhmA
MKLYSLRQRSRSEFLLGVFVNLAAPALVESMGDTGYDLLLLDGEHAPFGISELEALIRAADIANLPALVRVPELGSDIGRVLDLGAAGVMVPRIDNAAQAAEVVNRVRFAPEGTRGGGACRACDYGNSIAAYLAQANDHLLAIVQIETLPGFEAVEEIAATPGLDALCVGPVDLSMAIGHPMGSPEHIAATKRVFAAAHANGIAAIAVCLTAEDVFTMRAAGAGAAFYGMDRMFALNAMKEGVAAVKEAKSSANASATSSAYPRI